MRVEANSIEELLKQGNDPELMRQVFDIIEENTDLQPAFYGSETFVSIGYAPVPYKTKTYDSTLPLLAVSPLQNYIGVYISLYEDGQNILQEYVQDLPKSAAGKSCLRVRKIDETYREIIIQLTRRITTYYHERENV